MTKRGRKSAAELAVAPVISMQPRPVAPDHLTDEQAAVWESLVASMRHDYFRPSDFDQLANLCRHIVSARHISAWIEKMLASDEGEVAEVERLMKMRARETSAANALARSLRLTKQAQTGSRSADRAATPGGKKIWER